MVVGVFVYFCSYGVCVLEVHYFLFILMFKLLCMHHGSGVGTEFSLWKDRTEEGW